MKHFSWIVIVFSCIFTMPAMAADKNSYFAIQTDTSCGKWVEHRKDDSWLSISDRMWIAGFITAYNLQTPKTYHILGTTDPVSVALWMDNYCQKDPLSHVVDGMQALTTEVFEKRWITKP